MIRPDFFLNDRRQGRLLARAHNEAHTAWIFTLDTGIITIPFNQIELFSTDHMHEIQIYTDI